MIMTVIYDQHNLRNPTLFFCDYFLGRFSGLRKLSYMIMRIITSFSFHVIILIIKNFLDFFEMITKIITRKNKIITKKILSSQTIELDELKPKR